MESFLTACPRNCYSSCSFRVWTDKGRVVRIDPDTSNRAVPEGPCLKGLSYIERTHSPDRIIYPMQKVKNSFERISWEKALQIISDKLRHFRQEFGPHSILYYAGSGSSGLLNSISHSFWKLYGGATAVYGNLCWPAGLEATRLTLGENKHNAPWDLENAKMIILWGKNPAECNIQQMIPIEKAQKQGAKLVVIDPRRTPSAEKADILLQPKPGADGILALLMAKIIIEKKLHNKDFIKKHVKGFNTFYHKLDSLKAEKAALECGVDLKLIEKVAEMAGSVKPMTLIAGYGMQRYSNGGQSVRCLLTLPVITGNIGVSGGGWQYANLQSYIFDHVKEPQTYYPSADMDSPFRRTIPTARLGELMLYADKPELKMAWVERGNPLAQNPDSPLLRKAFEKLKFTVVVDQFYTDTAMEADIILPAKSMFEQSDIIGSYWHPYVLLKQKVVDPPGEVKPETEIYRLLAGKLNFGKDEIENTFPANSDRAIEAWLEKKLESFPDLSLEKLKKEPRLAPGYQEIAFSDLKFPTESGKIELYSVSVQKLWGGNPLPNYKALSRKDSFQHPYHLMSPNTKNRIHSQFGNLKLIKAVDSPPHVTISDSDARDKKLKNGDCVRIYNETQELIMPVKIDGSLRPGCIVLYNGYWNYNEGGPNTFSRGKETDMGHGAAFHDTKVGMQKFSGKKREMS